MNKSNHVRIENNEDVPQGIREHSKTIKDAYYTWMGMEHPKRHGSTNGDRKPNDLKNYERALRCFAAGSNNGVDDLSAVPQEALLVHDRVLGQIVERGSVSLNRCKTKVASEKTVMNLIACCKAVRSAVSATRRSEVNRFTLAERSRPKSKYRERFPQRLWPKGLLEDFEAYAAWKTKPILAPEEGDYQRRTACRPISIKAHASRLNLYIKFLVCEKGMDTLTLLDLCQPSHYADYLNSYLADEAAGGYVTAKLTGTTLATISQYLVAIRRIPERRPNGKTVWDEFYAMSKKALELGATRGQLAEGSDVGTWKPQDFLFIGREAWHTPSPRYRRGDEERYQTQTYIRLRSGLFFLLAFETPLRSRNFREMCWGKNLKRNADGHYELHFRGLELKVAKRGFLTNEYRHTYSEEASLYIDRWRDQLRERFGADFETLCPYVFAKSKGGARVIDGVTFSRPISALVYELRGETFHPHRVRHIVASYLVKEMKGGYNLAARLLGNKKETVMNTYDRPNNDEALQEYLTQRRKKSD